MPNDPHHPPPLAKAERSSDPQELAGDERKTLINEIVREIRNDSLKADVKSELEKRNRPRLLSRFFQHPAVMLLIGFAVTGLIGGLLANRWQRQEWNRQQARLVDIHGAELKYGDSR